MDDDTTDRALEMRILPDDEALDDLMTRAMAGEADEDYCTDRYMVARFGCTVVLERGMTTVERWPDEREAHARFEQLGELLRS